MVYWFPDRAQIKARVGHPKKMATLYVARRALTKGLKTKGGVMVLVVQERRRYGFWKFMIDAVLTVVTGGLWLIWIFVREMRRR